MRVTVVGAGVVGLTTALVLEERGHEVRVVAAAEGEETTSSVAAALWFPYRAGPPDKVRAWAARTRAWLEGLPGAAGVERLTAYDLVDEDAFAERPWWAGDLAVERAVAPVRGAPPAWRYEAPRVEPARFLPWVTARLRAPVERRVVRALDDEPGDVVVNCSGAAARALAADDAVTPLLGQVVLTDPGAVDPRVAVTDDRDADAMFYLIPRRDELVLGGCAIPWPPGAPPAVDARITARILAQAGALGLEVGPVRRVRAGLRPVRDEVRLERVGRVVHSYGHGGAGYTLCFGCAEDVAALV